MRENKWKSILTLFQTLTWQRFRLAQWEVWSDYVLLRGVDNGNPWNPLRNPMHHTCLILIRLIIVDWVIFDIKSKTQSEEKRVHLFLMEDKRKPILCIWVQRGKSRRVDFILSYFTVQSVSLCSNPFQRKSIEQREIWFFFQKNDFLFGEIGSQKFPQFTLELYHRMSAANRNAAWDEIIR